MDKTEIWDSIRTELELSLSSAHFATWIAPLAPSDIQEEGDSAVLTLSSPSQYVRGMVIDKYQRQIVEAAERIVGKETKLEIVIGKVIKKRLEKETTKSEEKNEAPLFNQRDSAPTEPQHNLNPRLTLDTYVVGSSNNFAHAAALGVIKNPGRKYNPLFIYGGVGLGKTHLMHAIGHAILEGNPRAKILYISTETFTNDLVASLQSKKTMSFKKR